MKSQNELKFLAIRNKVLSILLGIIFLTGLVIEIVSRGFNEALILFVVFTGFYFSVYLFFVRKNKATNKIVYAISISLLIFAFMSISKDPNIVFYIANIMLFIFISSYQKLGLTIVSSLFIQLTSAFFLLQNRENIFHELVIQRPDVIVFVVMTGFVHFAVIFQNEINRKTRQRAFDNEQKALQAKKETESLLENIQHSVDALSSFNEQLNENVDISTQSSNAMVESFKEMKQALNIQTVSVADIRNKISLINEDVAVVTETFTSTKDSSEETVQTIVKGLEYVKDLKMDVQDLIELPLG